MQPQIVVIGEGFDLDKLYVVCEGMVLCSIPHQSIMDSIVALLSSLYVFNMVYNDRKAIFSFFEQALMGIGRGHTLLNVNTLVQVRNGSNRAILRHAKNNFSSCKRAILHN